jgi:hypothetical protein
VVNDPENGTIVSCKANYLPPAAFGEKSLPLWLACGLGLDASAARRCAAGCVDQTPGGRATPELVWRVDKID